jgi:hypothetical protein
MTHTLTYRCYCKNGTAVDGRLTGHPPIVNKQDRDGVMSMILKRIASGAIDGEYPWDPFNLVLEVRAQAEPEPKGLAQWLDNKKGLKEVASGIACLTTDDFMKLLGADEEDEEDESNT